MTRPYVESSGTRALRSPLDKYRAPGFAAYIGP
jgi:hypothetical protein